MSKPGIEHPGVGVITIVSAMFDNMVHVLMIKRKSKHGFGKWSFPGGHLEFGEKSINAAMRELKEEIKVDGDPLEIFPIQMTSLATTECFHDEEDPKKHMITIVYGAPIDIYHSPHRRDPMGNLIRKVFESNEPEKHEEVKWFSLSNFPHNLPKYEDIFKAAQQVLFHTNGRVLAQILSTTT